MEKRRIEVFASYFGEEEKEAARVVAHAYFQKKKRKNPSMEFQGEKNPKIALKRAKQCLWKNMCSFGALETEKMTALCNILPADIDDEMERCISYKKHLRKEAREEIRNTQRFKKTFSAFKKTNFKKMETLLKWARVFAIVGGYTTPEKRKEIAKILEEHSYKANENVTENTSTFFDFQNQNFVGRYIIGQLMRELQKGGYVHQIIFIRIDCWRRKFGKRYYYKRPTSKKWKLS